MLQSDDASRQREQAVRFMVDKFLDVIEKEHGLVGVEITQELIQSHLQAAREADLKHR